MFTVTSRCPKQLLDHTVNNILVKKGFDFSAKVRLLTSKYLSFNPGSVTTNYSSPVITNTTYIEGAIDFEFDKGILFPGTSQYRFSRQKHDVINFPQQHDVIT